MYELLCRSKERPWASKPERLDCVPETANPKLLILHMQENRSHLSQDDERRAMAPLVAAALPQKRGC